MWRPLITEGGERVALGKKTRYELEELAEGLESPRCRCALAVEVCVAQIWTDMSPGGPCARRAWNVRLGRTGKTRYKAQCFGPCFALGWGLPSLAASVRPRGRGYGQLALSCRASAADFTWWRRVPARGGPMRAAITFRAVGRGAPLRGG